ncbi:MAG: low molecular weight protein-tyrosine-phosphatase [Woeseiaceae bacterium]
MSDKEKNISVLFVCMGNICRSPTAEGVFRHYVTEAGLAQRVDIDSAGTHAYHVGAPPDRRALAAAARRGFSMGEIRARHISPDDFARFDLILAMDLDNLALLREQSEPEYHEKICLFLEYASAQQTEVPDPYYGGATGFERVLDLVEDASRGLLEKLRISSA